MWRKQGSYNILGREYNMSIDYDNRERIFNANIQGVFKDVSSNLSADIDRIREVALAAYRKDLMELDRKGRVLDDLVAIAKASQISADVEDDELWRKIRALLEQGGLL